MNEFDQTIELLQKLDEECPPKFLDKPEKRKKNFREQEEKSSWNKIEKTIENCGHEIYALSQDHASNKKRFTYLHRGIMASSVILFGAFVGSDMLSAAKSLIPGFLLIASMISFFSALSFWDMPFIGQKTKLSEKDKHQVAEMIGYGALCACADKRLVYQKILKLYQKDQQNARFWNRILSSHKKYLRFKQNPGLPDGVVVEKDKDMVWHKQETNTVTIVSSQEEESPKDQTPFWRFKF